MYPAGLNTQNARLNVREDIKPTPVIQKISSNIQGTASHYFSNGLQAVKTGMLYFGNVGKVGNKGLSPKEPVISHHLVDPLLLPMVMTPVQVLQSMDPGEFEDLCAPLEKAISKLNHFPNVVLKTLMNDEILIRYLRSFIKKKSGTETSEAIITMLSQKRATKEELKKWQLTHSKKFPALQSLLFQNVRNVEIKLRTMSPGIMRSITKQNQGAFKSVENFMVPQTLGQTISGLLSETQDKENDNAVSNGKKNLETFTNKVLDPLNKKLGSLGIERNHKNALIFELIQLTEDLQKGLQGNESQYSQKIKQSKIDPPNIANILTTQNAITQQRKVVKEAEANLADIQNTLTTEEETIRKKQIEKEQKIVDALVEENHRNAKKTSQYLIDQYFTYLKKPSVVKTIREEQGKLALDPSEEVDLTKILGAAFLRMMATALNKTEEKATQQFALLLDFMFLGGINKAIKVYQVFQKENTYKGNKKKFNKDIVEAIGPVLAKGLQTVITLPGQIKSQKVIEELSFVLDDNKFTDASKNDDDPDVKEIKKHLSHKNIASTYNVNLTPVKAGTIAQIHQGWEKPGNYNNRHLPKVALKVVKPSAQRGVLADLDLMKPLAHLLEGVFKGHNIQEQFDMFANVLKEECNMEREAQNLKDAKRLVTEHPNVAKLVYVPDVMKESTDKVLVMEWLQIKNASEYAKEVGSKRAGKEFFKAFVSLVFDAGVCQADPHPGNMPYDIKRKKFAFIDAGLVRFLEPKEGKNPKLDFTKLLMGLSLNSSTLIKKAMIAKEQAPEAKLKEFSTKVDELFSSGAFLNSDSIKDLTKVLKMADKLNVTLNCRDPLLWKTLIVGYGTAFQTINTKFVEKEDGTFEKEGTEIGESKFSLPLAIILLKKLISVTWKEDKQFMFRSIGVIASRIFASPVKRVYQWFNRFFKTSKTNSNLIYA